MEKELIGFIDLVTFSGRVYPFLVYSDNTIDCPVLNMEEITKLYLKPRFELEAGEAMFTLSSEKKNEELIKEFICDDNIFCYLYDNNMISFSTDMAYLYDLPVKEGVDFEKKHRNMNSGTPYKWANKKGQILTKQKSGNFN